MCFECGHERPCKRYTMINRVLIRIKVIQILYSCLVVENKFTLEPAPAEPTKERRYAYRLYVDLLALTVMLSRQIEYKKAKLLMETRFVKRINDDDVVRQTVARLTDERTLDSLAVSLGEKIKESGLYKNFIKDLGSDGNRAEDMLWSEFFKQIILPDAGVKEYAESLDGYTEKAFERTEEMVLDTLTNFMTSQDTLEDAENTLAKSLNEARDLYFRMLALAADLTYMQERRLEQARKKHLATPEDLNPNLRFVENLAVAALTENRDYRKYIEDNKINWNNEDPLLMERLLKSVLESDIYREYMESPAESDSSKALSRDSRLWRELFRKVILVNADFLEYLEDKSVFWNDDVEIMGTFVVKTFRRIEEGDPAAVLKQYKDDEDKMFGPLLLRYVYKNRERYDEWISQAVADSEWKADRLAFMDVVVIMTALAEMLNFPKIPLNVTMNEYIEIAKSYSTSKSGQFVNGLLASIIKKLQDEHILLKK